MGHAGSREEMFRLQVLRGLVRQSVAPGRGFPGAMGVRFAHATGLTSKDVEERVLEGVRNTPKIDPSKVTPGASFINDLGLDSLDTVEVVMAIEEEFAIQIPDSDAEKIHTCQDII